MNELKLPELISPEGLMVAQAYLVADGNIEATAKEMNLPVEQVQQHLDTREVRNYVDRIYEETGFRNKYKIGKVMDAIIAQKLEEMDETELGSSKDISELLEMQHKMNIQHLTLKIKLLELEAKKEQQIIANQTNVQVNNMSGGEGYNKLLDKLLNKNASI